MPCGGCRSGTKPTGVQRIVTGAAGLAKAAAGIDRAGDATVQARRDLCRECPEATRNSDLRFAKNRGLTTLSRCKLCDCFIAAKTLIRSETCPAGKWPAVTG